MRSAQGSVTSRAGRVRSRKSPADSTRCLPGLQPRNPAATGHAACRPSGRRHAVGVRSERWDRMMRSPGSAVAGMWHPGHGRWRRGRDAPSEHARRPAPLRSTLPHVGALRLLHEDSIPTRFGPVSPAPGRGPHPRGHGSRRGIGRDRQRGSRSFAGPPRRAAGLGDRGCGFGRARSRGRRPGVGHGHGGWPSLRVDRRNPPSGRERLGLSRARGGRRRRRHLPAPGRDRWSVREADDGLPKTIPAPLPDGVRPRRSPAC